MKPAVRHKIEQSEIVVRDNKTNIICFTEHWLQQEERDIGILI